MEALAKKHRGRIVALRIHATERQTRASGAIRDRDLRQPAMRNTWRAAERLGLAIQMHLIPYAAPQVGELAAQFGGVPVILDHLARAAQGTAAEFDGVLKLAKFPVRRAFDAFGPDRTIWGGLGHNMEDFRRAVALFEQMFDFASDAERAKIRGLNAARLFGWPA